MFIKKRDRKAVPEKASIHERMKQLKNKKQSASVRIFLSYIGSCIALILVMSISVNKMVAQRLEEQTVGYYQNLNSQISRTADFMINDIYQNGYAVFKSVEAQNAMTGSLFTPENFYTIRKTLNDCHNINSFIDSVYFINIKENMVFTSELYTFPLNEFYDKGVMENAIQSKGKYFVPRTAVLEKLDGTIEKKYLTMYYANYDYDGEITGAMVINLDQDILADVLTGEPGNENNHVLVLDMQGIVVASDDASQVNTSIVGTPVYEKIQNNRKMTGNFIEGSGSNRSLIVYQKSDKLGMMIVAMTAYGAIAAGAAEIQRWIIIISGIILIGAVVLSGILTKSTYSPISKLVSQIQEKLRKTDKVNRVDYGNEFEYLTDIYQNLILQLDKLNGNQYNLLNSGKKEFLIKLLEGGFNSEAIVRDKCERFQIKDTDGDYQVMVVKFDHFHECLRKYSMEDIMLLKYSMGNILGELTIQNGLKGEIVENGMDYITALLFGNGKAIDQNLLNKTAADLCCCMEKFFQISCSAGIGLKKTELLKVRESNKEALTAVNYRLLKGGCCVVSFEEIAEQEETFGTYPYNEEANIINAVKTVNNEKAQEALEAFTEAVSGFNAEEIEGYMHQLMAALSRLSKQNPDNEMMDYRTFSKKLTEADTLLEKQELIKQDIQGQIQERMEQRKSKNEDLVSQIIAYIEQNYSNPSMTVEAFAEHIQLSPNQMRTIFKDAFHVTPIDYVVNFRIEKAKELLEKTDQTAKNIAAEVGYENTRYFYALFKKRTGMTCSEYRNLIRKDGGET